MWSLGIPASLKSTGNQVIKFLWNGLENPSKQCKLKRQQLRTAYCTVLTGHKIRLLAVNNLENQTTDKHRFTHISYLCKSMSISGFIEKNLLFQEFYRDRTSFSAPVWKRGENASYLFSHIRRRGMRASLSL